MIPIILNISGDALARSPIQSQPDSLMIVCLCNAVSDSEIKDWVALGGSSVDQIKADLGLGTCCGKCQDCASEIIEDALSQTYPSVSRIRHLA
ncbi:MAG: (2Fe-2S)-binding protein [Burkholderiaceae bacterium]